MKAHVGMMVEVYIDLDVITEEQAIREVKTSIEFGNPTVKGMYILPDAEDETTAIGG